jgi:fumarate reductase subunit D
MLRPSQQHPAYWAFLLHRLSGVALAVFLPLHFLVLGLALQRQAQLDEFLHWSERWPVKLAETLLVCLLALHMTGGLRLLALEFLPWTERHKTLISTAFGISLFCGLLFLLGAA